MITCRELISFIDSYLERELPAPESASFEKHLGVCPACVAYLESYKVSIDLARKAHADCGAEGPPPDMPAELVSAILDSRKRR